MVDDCLQLEVNDVEEFKWLPKSCSYRRVHEGRGLPKWHYLISGDRNTVHKKNKSVKDRVVSETDVMEVVAHIVYWV